MYICVSEPGFFVLFYQWSFNVGSEFRNKIPQVGSLVCCIPEYFLKISEMKSG